MIGIPGQKHMVGAAAKTRNGRSTSLLSVAVLAWIGVLAVPCTVFASAVAVGDSVEIEKRHGDCHGSRPSTTTASDECCCDPPGITAGETPKTEKASAVVAISVARSEFQFLLAPAKVRMLYGLPPNEFPPPVYLLTQRLRI